jgi:outer membrane porin
MKKSLIALGVLAAVVGVAQAENQTTLYGSMAHSVVVADDAGIDKTVWDLNRSVARFGIRGQEDLNGGLQAFYRFEFDVNDNGIYGDASQNKGATRYAYLGLRGDFGTLTLGRQDTLFKKATSFNDNFQDVYFKYHHGPNRLSKVISYVSPDMSGFTIGASMVLDGDNSVIKGSDSKGIDAWEAAAFYEANGFFAGGAYQSRDVGKKTDKYYGGSVGYEDKSQFKVGFGYEKQSKADSYYNLAGEYYLGDNTFRAGFGVSDNKGKNDDWFEYALGYQYNLSKRTYTWIEGSYYDPRAKGKDDTYQVVVGVRHDF